jgi:hypothetical protein
MVSYIMSIGCIALKRIRGKLLSPSKFDLRRAGLPLNVVSLVFLLFVFFFSFWPVGRGSKSCRYELGLFDLCCCYADLAGLLLGQEEVCLCWAC